MRCEANEDPAPDHNAVGQVDAGAETGAADGHGAIGRSSGKWRGSCTAVGHVATVASPCTSLVRVEHPTEDGPGIEFVLADDAPPAEWLRKVGECEFEDSLPTAAGRALVIVLFVASEFESNGGEETGRGLPWNEIDGGRRRRSCGA